MSLCIGITSFNCLEYLRNNVSSIVACSDGLPIHILVVDNGSVDGTAEWIAQSKGPLSENVILDYSLNSFNPRASFGCFVSISYFLSQTECRYFLHLDPDCEIRKPGTFQRAIQQLESSPRLGAIGERRYQMRYQHPKSRSLRSFDSYVINGSWSMEKSGRGFSPEEMESLVVEDWNGTKVYKELCGNVMFFKREIIEKIGNIDIIRYKMWRWDSEYSMRCMLFGYSIDEAEVVKSGEIKHFGGRTRLRAESEEKYKEQVRKDLSA